MNTIAHKPNNFGLPFVRSGLRGGKRKNWAVKSSGDYQQDYATGKEFAAALIDAIRHGVVSPFYASQVIEAMPGEKGPIESAFIAHLAVSAAH